MKLPKAALIAAVLQHGMRDENGDTRLEISRETLLRMRPGMKVRFEQYSQSGRMFVVVEDEPTIIDHEPKTERMVRLTKK